MVEQARLRRARSGWFDVNVLSRLSVRDLFLYHGAEYFLDAWYGDAGASDYMNYSAHRAHYAASLSPEAGGHRATAYARVVRGEEAITVQYWLFYYYNDWFNKHEGDWEMVQVTLDSHGRPRWLVLSQHHGGTRRAWSAVTAEDETHPAVFVALGSHANYFWGAEVYANVRDVGGEPFVAVDRTGRAAPAIPQIALLPELEELAASLDAWPGMEWIRFGGNWGERSLQSDFGGPRGPAHKAEQWGEPYEWGMAQPLDEEEWYAHRLRLAAHADGPVTVDLAATSGLALEELDCIPGDGGKRIVCILHRDPDPYETIGFSVAAPQGSQVAVTTVHPDPVRSQTTQVTYDEIGLAAGHSLVGRLCAWCGPGLALTDEEGQAEALEVAFAVDSRAAVWDAPDIVWMAGLLPAADIVRGIGLALLAGLGPTLIYVLGIYWVDRYEQEPKGLLAAAFFWGAIPAVVTAVVVRLVFRLPPSLLGPEAVEAVGAGVVAPLVEELLKGGAVLFIFLRHRREFDGVVDGIVYGAMVGFGFAMTGNTISYLGAFLLHGWPGLGARVFTRGLVYGLNHALYTAILGAGLGFARTMRAGRPRWAPTVGAFLLAVLAHAAHNVVVRQALEWSVITVVATWVGVFAVAGLLAWALMRERRVLVAELAGEIPDDLFVRMLTVGGRPKMRWQALVREGWRGRQRVRRQQKLCAELAFKKAQTRRHPDEPLAAEIDALREQVQASVRETRA
jgi:RsiW-degrading membrane proteinase PrsW (M82 family)